MDISTMSGYITGSCQLKKSKRFIAEGNNQVFNSFIIGDIKLLMRVYLFNKRPVDLSTIAFVSDRVK